MNTEGLQDDLPQDSGILESWFSGWLGQYLLRAERNNISRVLPDLFGYHLVKLGLPADTRLIESSRINHKVIVATSTEPPVPGVHLISAMQAFPIATDSLDVVVLHHVLEFERNPHQILRELERVLIGEGHAVIIGFNPWSLWGLWRLLRAWRGRAPWNGKFIGMARLRDWLQLLDFEMIRSDYFFYRPPLENRLIMRKLAFLEQLGHFCWRYFGGIYIVAAKKRVIPMTPIMMQWQKRRSMIATGLAEPSG